VVLAALAVTEPLKENPEKGENPVAKEALQPGAWFAEL